MRHVIQATFLLIALGGVLLVRRADAGPVYYTETRTIATNNVYNTVWGIPACGTCVLQPNGTFRWDVYVTDYYHLTFSNYLRTYDTLDPGPGNWVTGPPQVTGTTTAIREGGTAVTHYFAYAVTAPPSNPLWWSVSPPIVKEEQTVALEQTVRWYRQGDEDDPIPPVDPLAWVPEPTTPLLTGSGLIALSCAIRWKRRSESR